MPRDTNTTATGHATSDAQSRLYPRFARRLRAALLDMAILLFAFLGGGMLLAHTPLSGEAKVVAMVAFIVVLEPVLVALAGGTIGHLSLGLRVVDRHANVNIGILRALVRFVAKSLLGWVSMVFILITQQRQALHDKLVGSVVILRNPHREPVDEHIEAYAGDDPRFVYPSNLWRGFIVVLYVIALLMVYALAILLTLSAECIDQERCTAVEAGVKLTGSILLIGAIVAIVLAGSRGQLPGARRRLAGANTGQTA